MQAHHRSELRARDHVHITALSSLRTCALVVALFLCLPLCASAATHKPPAKRAHAVVTAAVQEADAGILLAPWELMALKIGSILQDEVFNATGMPRSLQVECEQPGEGIEQSRRQFRTI